MKFRFSILIFFFPFFVSSQTFNQYFSDSEVDGVISIYDLKNDTWIHSDHNKAKKGKLPASTFKIIHTLIGLEENIIKRKNDTIRWDGTPKVFKTSTIPNWNKDNDLEMAFMNSTIWYYEEIAKKINRKKYCQHLKKTRYSNRKLKDPKGFDFWNYGKLKVSTIEQIELLIKLYHNQLPFKVEHQNLTKELMIESESPNQTLRSKTGWCYDVIDIGWYIGFLELEDNTIFFATRIEKPLEKELKGFSKLRKSITKQIITKLYNLEMIW